MKRYVIILIFALAFGQIIWQIEVADSIYVDNCGIGWASLKLDTLIRPRIVYYQAFGVYDTNWVKLIYLYKDGNQWIKETVDSSYGYCATNYYIRPSLCLDRFDRPHIAYVHRYENNTCTLYYANKISENWLIQKLDGIPYHWSEPSLALDTSDYPCIAWYYRTTADTIGRIKYIHWDGLSWNSEIIYDGNDYRDYGPSLAIDSKNHPHIAYYQSPDFSYLHDSVKYAYWDGVDWIFPWAESIGYGSEHGSLGLALNNLDHPHIAYCKFPALYYAYFDGGLWHIEFTGDVGSWEIRLDLDNYGLPHIVYIDQMGQRPEYCYRDSTTWHICGYIEPDPYVMSYRSVSFCLDDDDNPHVAYIGMGPGNWSRMKYARGTFVGIEGNGSKYMAHTGLKIGVYPSVAKDVLNVNYSIASPGDIEIAIYDVCGRKVRAIKQEKSLPGNYHNVLDINNFPAGVYFVVLKQNNQQMSKKFLLIK